MSIKTAYDDNFILQELFCGAGGEKPIKSKISTIKKQIAKYERQQALMLESINDIMTAKGSNLRRIASYVGFFSDLENDDEFLSEFEFYLYSLNSSGSLVFIQEALEKLGADLSKIDVWQEIATKQLKLDGSFLLNGDFKLNPENAGFSEFAGWVDFLVFNGHIFNSRFDFFIDRIRHLGRRTFAREVIECYGDSPNSLVYDYSTLKLDGSFLLDGTFKLNPFQVVAEINEIRIGNGSNGTPPSPVDNDLSNTIFSSNLLRQVTRQADLIFTEANISEFKEGVLYDEIGFFSSNKLIYKITFSQKRSFIFRKKAIRLQLDGAITPEVKIWGSFFWGDGKIWG